ncbi:NAD(P)-dependent alcohol dehydrogenase [Streptomyces sp. SLBN-115]|uniref:NAD(P)-dependent alcohol dehydrogenase n=1 Tax=Streptomyces sp. SLBN-115 TaxID=2768453 RepID=UPI00114EBB53|nr:NAD(P)-dependent alcohol dehydrogenase [Streptomyces sp. SLBN-115]TQJ46578.1 NADPH:quinone reductase-like Zn-dependent oxidoreductase [Streptomyces sp. SLBN-115]
MKAIAQERFGPPDILELVDTDRPEVSAGQVSVRVRAAALNPYDWHMLRGDPYVARLMGGVGLTRPKCRVAGIDVAGQVESVGAGVRGLRPGDEVLGFCHGSFAEYARTTADLLVPKPAGLTFEQAAAVPMAAVTALRGIRTVGRVRAGQRVLVNGAAGGVGTFAVQIAVALDAEVTGVCSTSHVDLVRSLGAAHVVDHIREDFTEGGERYDVILDNVGNRPLSRLRQVLTPTGTLVANGGGSPGRVFGAVGSMLRVIAVNGFVRQQLRTILPSTPAGPAREDLLAVTALIEAGSLTPVIDRTYPLADAAEGMRYVERGHAHGKAVITVA